MGTADEFECVSCCCVVGTDVVCLADVWAGCPPFSIILLDIGVQILAGSVEGGERVVSVTIDGAVRVFSIGESALCAWRIFLLSTDSMMAIVMRRNV